jgi:hypothetical protein
MARRMNRRRFLRGAAAGGAAFVVLSNSGSARSAEANTRLNIALIGVGGRGTWFVDTIPKAENIVAFCDVNQQKTDKAFERWAKDPARVARDKVKAYHDFRRMFDEMGKAIDAAVVATPDHTHAAASAAAMHAGKHVYCEKPLTRLVAESRALRDLARKQKVATSMGNQGTASGAYRRAVELIRGGTIGEIKEVHSWTDSGGSDFKDPPKDPPSGPPPVPDYLKWDLWLGPCADRPYHPRWHRQWHSWRDFGTANLGNWASHIQNLAFRALKVHALWLAETPKEPHPVIKVEAETSGANRLSFPKYEIVRWEIPAREDLPPVTFTWHAGNGPVSRAMIEDLLGRGLDWGDKGEKKWADWAGHLIVGTKGKILANAHNTTFTMMPEADFKDVKKNAPEKLARSRGHEADWLLACRGNKPAWANFDYAGALTEFNMLGNVATQFEGTLEFDPVVCRIRNHAEADKAMRLEYRRGWSL